MASNCYGRRLSELLQEQQEPFLPHRGKACKAPHCRSVAEACGRRLRGLCDRRSVGKRRGHSNGGGGSASGRTLLCGGKAVSRVLPLPWDLLAGCFSCVARERFRRLPRAADIAGEFGDGKEDRDGGRQLSPVSVLQLRSDEESTNGDGEDESKPSTSASSPHSDHGLRGAASPCGFTVYSNSRSGGEARAMEAEDDSKLPTKRGEPLAKRDPAMIVSAWERIAADISRVPRLVELDLSASAPEWRRRRVGEDAEARRVGESIEAMIFEEVRWEAVRDMLLCVPSHPRLTVM